MRICRNLMLIAALAFTLWVLPNGSQAGIYSSRGSKAAADAGEVAVASDTEGLE
jgi:hypothetical protein